jgi:hypothetical protein
MPRNPLEIQKSQIFPVFALLRLSIDARLLRGRPDPDWQCAAAVLPHGRKRRTAPVV